jgi:2-polyprenyl-3-methyl-5-hydroxy-6-metoxy-1,4-benzoquinol methylase
LLDVGCGDGKLLYEVARKTPSKRIVGIDYSERAILFSKAFNYGNGVESICGDVASMKEVFDVVVTVETLEHIPDAEMEHVLQAIHDRTKKGGRVIVSVPCANVPLNSKHFDILLEMLRILFQHDP